MLRRVLNERELAELGLSGSADQTGPAEVLTFRSFLLIRRFCCASFISFWSLIAVLTTRFHYENVISPPAIFHWVFILYLSILSSFEVLIAFSISNSPWEGWDIFALAVGIMSRLSVYVDALFVVQTAKMSSMLFIFSGTLFFCGVIVVTGLVQFRVLLSLFSKRDKFSLSEPQKVWKIYAVSQLLSDLLRCCVLKTSDESQNEIELQSQSAVGVEVHTFPPPTSAPARNGAPSVQETAMTECDHESNDIEGITDPGMPTVQPIKRIYSVTYGMYLLAAQLRVAAPSVMEKSVDLFVLSTGVAGKVIRRLFAVCSGFLETVANRTLLCRLRQRNVDVDEVQDSPLIASEYPSSVNQPDPAPGTQLTNQLKITADPSLTVDENMDPVHNTAPIRTTDENKFDAVIDCRSFNSKVNTEVASTTTPADSAHNATVEATDQGAPIIPAVNVRTRSCGGCWSNSDAKRTLRIHTAFLNLDVGHVKVLQTLNMNYCLDLLFLQSTLSRTHLHPDSLEAHEFSSAIVSLSRCFCEDVLQVIIKVYAVSTLGLSPFLVWACLLSIVEPFVHCLFNTVDATPLEELFVFE